MLNEALIELGLLQEAYVCYSFPSTPYLISFIWEYMLATLWTTNSQCSAEMEMCHDINE